MRSYFLLISFFVSLLFLSCGDDGDNNDSVIDEPNQEETSQNIHPTELVGTWVYYSGTARTVLSTNEGDMILNQILEFASNGYFAETITVKSHLDYIGGETSTLDGRWWVSGKQIMFSDKYGNPINTSLAYLFEADSALSLNAARYYPSAKVSNYFSSTIVGTWENYRTLSGKERIVANSNGSGVVYIYYSENVYGAENMTWKLKDDSLTINYNSWAYPTSLHEYKINYLNTKHLSLTGKDGESFYSKN
jgi:hypothetical protein